MKGLLNKIGQLQYEISCLELDEETLTGVTVRTEELKELINQGQTLPIDSVIVAKRTLCECIEIHGTDRNTENELVCLNCKNPYLA